MKKISVLLVVVLLLSLAASACAEREFVDSTGRTVTVPDEIDKVAVSGPMTQIILVMCSYSSFLYAIMHIRISAMTHRIVEK